MTTDYSATPYSPSGDAPLPPAPSASGPEAVPLQPAVPAQAPTQPLRRVLHLINGEHYSGAERVQDLLAARLPEQGYEAHLACLKPDRFPEACQCPSDRLHQFPMTARFDLRVVGRICEMIQESRFELLHAHTPRTLMVGKLVADRCRLPLVYHVHSPTSRDSTRGWMNRINAATEWLSLGRVARLITVSESLRRHVVSLGIAPERITVVPNGVPAASQYSHREPPASPWKLGTIALFRPRKGTEVLLQAVARVRQAGHDVQLNAVGSFETDDYQDQLLKLTSELQLDEHVNWLGFQRDVESQLANMDLFVLPSLFGEGMPMVVLEAMAMGVPVVGTRVEGVPEVVRDGTDGRLSDPGNPDDLAEALVSMLEGEINWQLASDAVRERHTRCFSDHSMAAGVAAVYNAVVPANVVD